MIAQLLIMVVQRAHEKDPSSFAILLLCILKKRHLYHYADAFYQEHAAEDGYKPFFSDDDCQGGDDAAESEASGIAHEYLGGVSVVPEKSETGADERADKDGQFSQIRYIHDVQVFCKTDIAAGVSKDAQAGADDGTGAGGKAIQSVC